MAPLSKKQIAPETMHLIQNSDTKPVVNATFYLFPSSAPLQKRQLHHCPLPFRFMGQCFFWYVSQPSRQKGHPAIPFLDFCIPQEKLSNTAAFLHRDSIWHLWLSFLTDLCVHSCFVFRVLSLSSVLLWQHFQYCQAQRSVKQ